MVVTLSWIVKRVRWSLSWVVKIHSGSMKQRMIGPQLPKDSASGITYRILYP